MTEKKRLAKHISDKIFEIRIYDEFLQNNNNRNSNITLKNRQNI